MTTAVFRKMTLADVPDIVAIEQQVFTLPWTADAFTNELVQNHFAKYVVLLLDGQLAGYGGMWMIVDEAHVTNVAIAEQFHRQGWGERLLSEMQRIALDNGALRMTLEVRVSNVAAQKLYRKKGFERAGIRPGYYSDNGEDALIMWAEL